MTPSRRSFLHTAAMFAVASSSVSLSAFAQGKRELTQSEEIGLQTLSSDPQKTFEKWIGGKFHVTLRGRSHGLLVLDSVDSTTSPAPSTSQPPAGPGVILVQELSSTALQFSKNGQYLPQDTYTLDHDWLGTFDLLIVPTVPYSGPITYSATFTRFTGRNVPWKAY